jgi:hypothetical protein
VGWVRGVMGGGGGGGRRGRGPEGAESAPGIRGGVRGGTRLGKDGTLDSAQASPVEDESSWVLTDPWRVERDAGEAAGAAGLGLLRAGVGRAVRMAAAAGSEGLHDGARIVGGEAVAAKVEAAQARAREDVWQQLVDEEELGRLRV